MKRSKNNRTDKMDGREVSVSDLSTLHHTIQAIWRIESAKVIATLARLVNDIGLAEDFAQEALLAALEQWLSEGVPDNPRAWLIAIGKNKAIDFIRGQKTAQRHLDGIAYHLELDHEAPLSGPDEIEKNIKDDLLRLIFTACHPSLSFEAQAALALRILCGLTVEEIARAFLISESAVSQRIVRAKRTLAEEKVQFEFPAAQDLPARLQSVLEVLYLLFNEGYSATHGENWVRADLCDDALRVGRILAALLPREPEVHGLVALMEIQASRIPARLGPNGEPILLRDQNRVLWDRLLIQRGLDSLATAENLSESLNVTRGPILLQAEIAACHARSLSASETDWSAIVQLYDELLTQVPSPVIELNRAVAVSIASGPQVGLDLVDRLVRDSRLENYHLLPSVRGDLLFQLARHKEARIEFTRASEMAQNEREKELLLERAHRCVPTRHDQD
jgi:RNA polymerase sigma factor (sigma-70 family)